MKRVLVCKHIAQENLGFLRSSFRLWSARLRYVNFAREPEADLGNLNYDLIVLLGGKMGVYESHLYPHLEVELNLVKKALDQEIPVLGICLGAQLLAKALGGEVQPMVEKEMGWKKIELTEAGLADSTLSSLHGNPFIFQMHGDCFSLPADAVHLATSELCANQAFRWGRYNLGLQFHLESDQHMIANCLNDADLLNALGPETDAFRKKEEENSLLLLPKSKRMAQRFFDGYLTEIWGPPSKGENRNWRPLRD